MKLSPPPCARRYAVTTVLGSDEWIELEPGVGFLIQEDDGSGEGDQGDGGGDKPPGTASVTFTFKVKKYFLF